MMGIGTYGLFGGLGMWADMVLWFLVIGLVFWSIAKLVERPATVPQRSALEILQQRYARGEISQAEFIQARRDLSQEPIR